MDKEPVLYIFRGYRKENAPSSRELLYGSLELFLRGKGKRLITRPVLKQTSSGKPYFFGESISFSISHSGDLWACLMAEGKDPLGLDVQEEREVSRDKIAGRWFTPEESDYVRAYGKEAFFSIWVRKEAFTKFYGIPLSMTTGKFALVENQILMDELEDVRFHDLSLVDSEESRMYGAYALRKEIEPSLTVVYLDEKFENQ